MHIDIVIPTWQRPDKLERCIASIKSKFHGVRTWPIDDTERLFAFGVWNRFLKGWHTGDAFVYLCDDVELDPQAIDNAMAQVMRFGLDGMVGFFQRNIVGKAGTSRSAMGLVGRRFAERFPDRQLFCPDYSRFHADSELGEYAHKLKRMHFSEAVSLVHYHPVHCPGEMDLTHKIVREPAEVARDKQTYRERKRLGLLWGESFKRVNT